MNLRVVMDPVRGKSAAIAEISRVGQWLLVTG